ncbi:MAG TPA: SPFH domain-containing protein [Rhodanobacter sp.]|jgi:regulator of protease activity HflC (stomatin/prohibitin superfamily)|nr:SPFH domain-containing protein [Rhodanobacter sp.]
MMTLLTLLLVLPAVLIISAVKVVPAGQVHSLYRRGKPVRLLSPGMHLVLPLLDRVAHKINLAGQTLRFEEPLVDAHDVRGTVYWQVLEPERADAVFEQVDQLIRRGTMEALRGETAAERVDRRDLGARLKKSLNSALRERGMMVTRVELDAA